MDKLRKPPEPVGQLPRRKAKSDPKRPVMTRRSCVEPGFYSVVAEKNGNVVGSNFLDEHVPIARRAAG